MKRLALLLAMTAGCSDDAGTVDAAVAVDAAPLPVDAAATVDAGTVADAAADATTGGGDAGLLLLFEHELSPHLGAVVFNEVLIDGTTDGDPNGDGDSDPVADQFVELVSGGDAPLLMDGFTLLEQNLPALPRHRFDGLTLGVGHAVVVFGGGDAPPPTATATFLTANAADPGIPFGLNLNGTGSYLLLLDADEKLVAYFCYGDALPIPECELAPATDQSLTQSPDETGDFVPHTAANGSGGAAFSAGTR